MTHEFDFVTWLLGCPNKVTTSGVEGREGESHVIALLNYDDVIVEVQSSSMMPDHHPFTVAYEAMFENGTVEFMENGYADREEKSLLVYTNQGRQEVEPEVKNCYEEAIKHVLECCEKNIPTRLGIDEAVTSLEITLKVKEMLSSE